MGVKIDTLVIHGLQGYYEPVEFKLSDGLTLIKGDNSSGKTAVARILKAYQYKNSAQEELSSLLSIGMNMGYSDVKVFHEDSGNSFTVRHCVYRENPLRLGNYYEIYDHNFNVIYRTEFHDDNISKYMGFEVIEEPNGCFPLNFKGAKVNAFIDTPLMTNTYILDGLCYIEDYELRIENIKDAIGKLNDIKKEYTKDLRYFVTERNKKKYTDTSKLDSNISSIERNTSLLEDIYGKIEFIDLLIDRDTFDENNTVLKRLLDIVNKMITVDKVSHSIEAENVKNQISKMNKILIKKQVLSSFYRIEEYNSQREFCNKTGAILSKNSKLIALKTEKIVQDLHEKMEFFFVNSRNKIDSIYRISSVNEKIIGNSNKELIRLNSNYINKISYVTKLSEMVSNINKSHEYYNNLKRLIYLLDKLILNYYSKEIIYKEGYKKSIAIMTDNLNTTKLLIKMTLGIDIIKKSLEIDDSINRVRRCIPVCPTCGRANI